MSNIRNVVKVMNFHSLLRVDKAKKKADRYLKLEEELLSFMSTILNNKNLNLDKKLIVSNPNGKVINIYIANDLGFCSNFNSSVKKNAKEEANALKIIVGSKIFMEDKNILLNISKEECYADFSKISNLISPYLYNKDIKEINAIYNRYYSVSEIKIEKKKLFPLKLPNDSGNNYDFVTESDVAMIFDDLIMAYIGCEFKIIESNSWASENIMRKNLTDQSLKKIDELDEKNRKIIRKEEKYNAFKKQMSNYRKKRDDNDDDR